MTVTKCDRCGAVYEKPPRLMIGTLRTVGTVLIPGTTMLGASESAMYDLCDKCFAGLIGFLGEGAEGD